MRNDIVERLRGEHWWLDVRGEEVADEIENLRAYAKHERSLGAEGPMIELTDARQEIERLRAEVSRWRAAYEEACKLARGAEVYRVTEARALPTPAPDTDR